MRSVLILTLLCAATLARADGEKPGAFDYWVAALSWSPNWCAADPGRAASAQCADEADNGWILHGLWPQYDRGWPAYCPTVERAPSRGMTAEMADIMGTSGLAWHQWKKHGVCSGLSARAYYDLSREVYGRINRPEIFRKLDRPVTLPAALIEEAFIKANPAFEPDMITITCKDGAIQETRICLSRDDLAPVPCGRDVIRDCTLGSAFFAPIP